MLTRDHVIAEIQRRLEGRTQRDLAADLGISQQYLNGILLGKQDPGPTVLKKLGLERVILYKKSA